MKFELALMNHLIRFKVLPIISTGPMSNLPLKLADLKTPALSPSHGSVDDDASKLSFHNDTTCVRL